MVSRMMSQHGREVVNCASPQEAIEALKGPSFTAAMLDLFYDRVPAGYDFIRVLRADPETQGLPVVAMTGKDITSAEKCLDLGADAVLAKPFLAAEAFSALERASENRRAAAVLRGAAVLHIEDGDDWAELVGRWLREVGARSRRARNRGEVLLQAANPDGPPDAILLDLGLEGTDGFELLDAIKQSPALQAVPVVVLSSRTGARPEALRRRALCFIDKGPRTRDDLVPILASICDQHRRSRGFITTASMVFDPRSGAVRYKGALVATLDGRPLALFSLLACRGAAGATEEELFAAGQRRAGRAESHRAVHNYVSELRQLLGPELGALIRSLPDGRYALKFPGVAF